MAHWGVAYAVGPNYFDRVNIYPWLRRTDARSVGPRADFTGDGRGGDMASSSIIAIDRAVAGCHFRFTEESP
jgi:hypothetical protein